MPSLPKLTPAEWAKVRSTWEVDERTGYVWIVEAMHLPVSANAIKKRALANGWAKVREEPSATPDAARNGTQSALVPRTLDEPSKAVANHARTIDEKNAEELRSHKTRETPILDELDEAEPRQGLFVREYIKDLNGTQAAIRAGYARDSAHVTASRLLSEAKIQACVRELRDELLRGLEIEAKDVMQTLVLQLSADINEISQYRRVCCHHCHGDDHRYQCTPAEYERRKLAHDRERAKLLDKSDQTVDIGEFPPAAGDWYDKRREPNHECPECFGEGLGEVFFGDTRHLSKAARALYGGVKQTREGIEIVIANREKVIDQLARVLGMFKDQEVTVNVNVMNTDELKKLFWDRMESARARQQQVYAERGIVIENGDSERPH